MKWSCRSRKVNWDLSCFHRLCKDHHLKTKIEKVRSCSFQSEIFWIVLTSVLCRLCEAEGWLFQVIPYVILKIYQWQCIMRWLNGMTPDQSYFYLDNINTYDFYDSVTLSDIWFVFWVVLYGARSWIQWCLWVPSPSGYSVVL